MKTIQDVKNATANDTPQKELAPWELVLRQSRTASKGRVVPTTGLYGNAAATEIIRTKSA